MRISTRGRYGLRAVFEPARAFGEGPPRMSAINVLDNVTLQDMAASGGGDYAGALGERKGPAPARRENRRGKPGGATSHARARCVFV